MKIQKVTKIALAATIAASAGAFALPNAADAAVWNSVSDYTNGHGVIWESYVRSHTSTSDIKFDMNDSASDFRAGEVLLKYDSNGHVFADKTVGLGPVTLVSNWGATRFHFGFDSSPASGTVKGSLYY